MSPVMMTALVQGGLVRLVVRVVPERTLMIPGIAMLAIGLYLLPLGAHVSHAMFAMLLMAAGQGISYPCILSLISRCSGERMQGNVMGTSQSASSLARIIGPIFGGIFYDYGPRWPFGAAAAVMAVTVGWAAFTRGRLERVAEAQSAPVPAPVAAGSEGPA